MTSERLSSLSPQTRELIRDLKVDRPVQIEAFISPSVPEAYVQTRLNLLTMLRELQALGGEKVQVQIHDTERFSNEAALADKRYGIEPRQVTTLNHGALSMDHIFLNVAMSCGVQKVPPVFIDRGIPIEYELVRSICTVSQQKRKKLGVLNTDAQLYGSFNMQTMSPSPELADHRRVGEAVRGGQGRSVQADHREIRRAAGRAALVAGPAGDGQLRGGGGRRPADGHLRGPGAGVRRGRAGHEHAPAAAGRHESHVRRHAAAAQGRHQQALAPAGRRLRPPTRSSGRTTTRIPRPAISRPSSSSSTRAAAPRNRSTRTTRSVPACNSCCSPSRAPWPKLNTSDLTFTPLVRTGEKTGTVALPRDHADGALRAARRTEPQPAVDPHQSCPTSWPPTSRARCRLPPPTTAEKGEKDKKGEKEKPRESTVNAVVVADIDMLSQDFFRLREQGDMPEVGIHFDFDNVTFVLNVLDELAGDQRFIDIRKRRPSHRTLARIEERTKEAKQEATDAREQFIKDYEAEEQKEQQAIDGQDRRIEEAEERRYAADGHRGGHDAAGPRTAAGGQDSSSSASEKDRKINKIETDLALKVRQRAGPIQDVGGAVAADPAAGGGGDRVLHPPRARTRRRGPVEIAIRDVAAALAALAGDERTE